MLVPLVNSAKLAQTLIARTKPVCPRMVVPGAGRNDRVFYAGSAREQRVQIRRALSRVDPFWSWQTDIPRKTEEWRFPMTPDRLLHTADDLLFDLVQEETGIDWRKWEAPDTVQWDIGRAVAVAKFRLWGVPLVSSRRNRFHVQDAFFRRIFLGTIRPAVPESVWKLACQNACNGVRLNQSILKDALVEQERYQSLYALHPLLGRAWAPWVRDFVRDALGVRPNAQRYAEQLRAALGMAWVTPAGFRTLHRLAECCPLLMNDVLGILVGTLREADDRPIRQVATLLNGAQGRSRPAPGITWSDLFRQECGSPDYVLGHAPNGPLASFEDRVALVRIEGWMKRSPTARRLELDAGLIRDWMWHAHERGTGAVHRGFTAVVRTYQRPDGSIAPKGVDAALRWANRAQERWHDERRQLERLSIRNLSWIPLLEYTTKYEIVAPNGGCWTFEELLSSEDLWEEGKQMHHCVASYDTRCARGQSCIFAVSDPQGHRVSTLEIHLGWESPGHKRFVIEQHRGPRNAQVSAEAERAALCLLQFLDGEERIAQARARLAQRQSAYTAQMEREDGTIEVDMGVDF